MREGMHLLQINMKKNFQKGQTIIEALVALSTILLIITAISIVVVSGIYNSTYIKNQNEANKYAQQGIEIVRNIQQNNLSVFANYDQISTYCISTISETLTTDNCDGVNVGSVFKRIIHFSQGASPCQSGETKVIVDVSWSSSKCSGSTFCHKSELVACMPYNFPASKP